MCFVTCYMFGFKRFLGPWIFFILKIFVPQKMLSPKNFVSKKILHILISSYQHERKVAMLGKKFWTTTNSYTNSHVEADFPSINQPKHLFNPTAQGPRACIVPITLCNKDYCEGDVQLIPPSLTSLTSVTSNRGHRWQNEYPFCSSNFSASEHKNWVERKKWL